jgi:hypothetical protein
MTHRARQQRHKLHAAQLFRPDREVEWEDGRMYHESGAIRTRARAGIGANGGRGRWEFEFFRVRPLGVSVSQRGLRIRGAGATLDAVRRRWPGSEGRRVRGVRACVERARFEASECAISVLRCPVCGAGASASVPSRLQVPRQRTPRAPPAFRPTSRSGKSIHATQVFRPLAQVCTMMPSSRRSVLPRDARCERVSRPPGHPHRHRLQVSQGSSALHDLLRPQASGPTDDDRHLYCSRFPASCSSKQRRRSRP